MKRSASMLAGLIRVKNELPDDPKALEEMIQDFRGCGDSGSWHKHTSCMIHINSSFRTKFREDLQLELTADNVLPGYPGSPAPTLPATDSQLLVAGRRPWAHHVVAPKPGCLSTRGLVFGVVDLMYLGDSSS